MKIKYSYKNDEVQQWYAVENIKKIELTLRDETKAIITQKKEGELPRLRIKASNISQIKNTEKLKLTGLNG